MAERDLAPVGAPDGLRVLPRVGAGGRVADVADRHVALQRAQLLLVEDLVDEALVAHRHDVAALGGRDARGLLPAVLEGVQREVREAGDVVPRSDIRRTRRTRRAARRVRRCQEASMPSQEGPIEAASVATAPARSGRSRIASEPQRTRRTHGSSAPPVPLDRQRIKELTEREERVLNERTSGLRRDVRARAALALRRRRVVLPAARPVADLPRARRRPARLGRRRQRVLRLPQRLRLDGPGPRPPGDRQGDLRALRARHALRGADRGRDRRRRGARRAAGACRAGATRTPARSRRWTRSGSPARTRSATRS